MKKLQVLFWALAAILFIGSAQTAMAQARTAGQGSRTFTITNGKLGPVQIGKSMRSIPSSFAGLYDRYKKETFDFSDGDIGDEDAPTVKVTEYSFFKNGKNIFNVTTDEKLVANKIELKPGSSFIKTPEGFYVGYSARELFKKHPRNWDNAYEGEAWVDSGKFRYCVNNRFLTTEYPTAISHFRQNAKITTIYYFMNLGE